MIFMALDTMSIDGDWIKDNETKEYNEITYDDDKVNVNDVMNSVDVPITSFDEETDVNKIMDSVDVPEVEFEDDKDVSYYKKQFEEIYNSKVNLEKLIKDNSLIDAPSKVISSEDISKTDNKSGVVEMDYVNELISFTNALSLKYGKSNYDMWNDIEKEKYIQLYCKVYNVSKEYAIKSISDSKEDKVSEVFFGNNRNAILEQIESVKIILSDIYIRYNELSYNDQQLFLELYSEYKKAKYMSVTNSESEQKQLNYILNVASQVSEFNSRLNNRTK